jgi:hypothetical protein
MIFLKANIQAYEEKKISKTRFVEICRESGIISPSIYDPFRDEVRVSQTKAVYDKMYTKLQKEKQTQKETEKTRL